MSEHKIVDNIEHAVLEAEPKIENFIFGKPMLVIATFILVTVFLAMAASKVGIDTSFEKMVPAG